MSSALRALSISKDDNLLMCCCCCCCHRVAHTSMAAWAETTVSTYVCNCKFQSLVLAVPQNVRCPAYGYFCACLCGRDLPTATGGTLLAG